jgi:hypothetical protein
MRPQITPVGGKICRSGSYCRSGSDIGGPARTRETPVLLGFLPRHFHGTLLAEKHA